MAQDQNRLDARVSVLENERVNLGPRLDHIERLLETLVRGQQRHDNLITWGKGGLYMLTVIGAALFFLWNQFKGLFLGARVT